MSAQERELEQKTESKSSASSESTERAATEASSGKAELVAGFKKAIDALKLGGTSGITREFGKPILIDGASANAGPPETKAKLYKTGELSKLQNRITKESRKLTHADLVQNDRTNNFVENQSNQTNASNAGRDSESSGRNTESSGRNPESSGRTPESSGRNPESSGRNPGVVNMPAERITVSRDAAYHGETINRDVAPGTHTVAQGETPETISRQHLGADASADEVQAHAREIERVNHIDARHPIHASQELTLPGHTRDGGYVNRDAAGNTHTRWADNTERVDSANGSGYVQRRADDGSYTIHHWGRNPEENYELSRSADGRYLVADRPGEALHESSNPDDSRVAHARLSDLAESRISNPQELAQFRANMDQFEQRAREQHLPPDEVAKTYRQLDTLLSHTGSRPIPENQRIAIAEQVMDQAAHPTTIDQGQHLTCNVTAVETRLYTRNPSEAARLVTEVSTTGQFTARDGTVVHVPANSLHPDPEASHNPPEYGARSHASQLFQVTTLNMYHQTESFTYTDSHGRQHTVPPGGMRYEQHTPTPGRPNDHGERLIDTTTHPPQTVSRSADITEDGIVRVNNRLTGETGTDIMIDHRDDVYGNANGVTTVANEQELNSRIAQAAHDGHLPILIRVNSDNEPWLHDSGAGAAGGSGGAHIVTVTGYEAGPPARVNIDNQWGENEDYGGNRRLSVHDLYMSMRPADSTAQIAELQRDVDYDRAHNSIDTRKEFELLRLRHNLPSSDPNHLNDNDFNTAMQQQIDAAGARWEQQRANGTFNQAEHDNAYQKLGEMCRNQPPDRRIPWIGHIHSAHMISDADYDNALANAMRVARNKWADEDAHHTGNAGERQRARRSMDEQLNALPEDRRRAVIANSRR